MNCQDISTILNDCTEERMSAAERNAVDDHLSSCADCAHAWMAQEALVNQPIPDAASDLLQRTLDLFTENIVETPPRNLPPGWFLSPGVAWGTAMVMIVIVGVALVIATSGGGEFSVAPALSTGQMADSLEPEDALEEPVVVVPGQAPVSGNSQATAGVGASAPRSVAVLPFENLNANNEANLTADIYESILAELARVQDLDVIRPVTERIYPSIQEIGEELNVDAIMEGTVRTVGNRVFISTQLIDAETGAHLWADSYIRDLTDLLAVQADIAASIANALETEFSLSEQLDNAPTDSPEAYALYLRALSAPTPEVHRTALDRAIELDPEFALAYASRAAGETFRLFGLSTGLAPGEMEELERRVAEDAERALTLDPTVGVAHVALAAVHQANWRGDETEQAYQRAVELNPNDISTLIPYGRFKRVRGEYEEAVRLFERALGLVPTNFGALNQLGITHRYAGEWDAAAAILQEALELEPGAIGTTVHLASVEASRGNVTGAVGLLQIVEQLERPPLFRLAQIAHAFALAGQPGDAARLFTQMEERA